MASRSNDKSRALSMMSEQSSCLPTTIDGWRSLLKTLDIRPSKGLGQHFLFERGIIDRIIRTAGISSDDIVVEIGPGLGILTESLLDHASRVYAVELDRRLAEHLRRTFGECERLQTIEDDALDVDFEDVLPPDQAFDVVANLPYSSGTAILRRLLEQPRRPRRVTVMVQREVAERIAADPPDMTILGIATRFYATPRVAFKVPPSVFIPPPKVESAVLVLDINPILPLPSDQHARFFRVLHAGFHQKRKQLVNTLSDGLGLPKPEVAAWLVKSDVAPDRRPQTLSLEEWLILVRRAPENLA